MKTHIKDVLQVTAALLMTGGMASAMVPPTVTISDATSSVATHVEPAIVAPVEKPKIVEEKVITWKDNPKKCDQTTHYIAKDKPFNCIEKPKATPVAKAAPASFGGSCDEWIAAAGIKEVESARELIRRESGCNPNAVNASSGACGVAQELPCGKSGCKLGDGACQVRWMNGYVVSRYGSWGAAVSFHDANNWY